MYDLLKNMPGHVLGNRFIQASCPFSVRGSSYTLSGINAFWIGPTESFVSKNKETDLNFLTRRNIQPGEQSYILPESQFRLHGSPYDETRNDGDTGTE